MAAGPSLPTMMVSTTPCAIQPSSLSTTGIASASIARNSLLQSAWTTTSWVIFLMYMDRDQPQPLQSWVHPQGWVPQVRRAFVFAPSLGGPKLNQNKFTRSGT